MRARGRTSLPPPRHRVPRAHWTDAGKQGIAHEPLACRPRIYKYKPRLTASVLRCAREGGTPSSLICSPASEEDASRWFGKSPDSVGEQKGRFSGGLWWYDAVWFWETASWVLFFSFFYLVLKANHGEAQTRAHQRESEPAEDADPGRAQERCKTTPADLNHQEENMKRGTELSLMCFQSSRHSKLEKADILEMTVKHLRNLQGLQMTGEGLDVT